MTNLLDREVWQMIQRTCTGEADLMAAAGMIFATVAHFGDNEAARGLFLARLIWDFAV